MHVVVSGGSGLIGRRLVAGLAGDGHRVTVLSRAPERVDALPAGAAVAGWDARSVNQLTAVLEGVDAVVHLAGENIAGGRWTEERKRRIHQSRVVSTGAMAAAIGSLESPPGVLLQASAVGYYGDTGDRVVTEETPPADDFLGRVCREWEEASAAVEARGVRRVLLRTGIVLSTGGGALPRMLLPFRLFAGGPLGSGRQYFPWIHIGDQVGAIRFLLDSEDAAGPFNLTAPEPLTNREFSRVLGRVLRRPSLLPAPAFALKLALGEMAQLLLEGQRAVPRRLEQVGYAFRFPTAEAALRDLLG